jgi:hypothetical protein
MKKNEKRKVERIHVWEIWEALLIVRLRVIEL